MTDWLWSRQLSEICIFFFVLNLLILGGALFAGRLLEKIYAQPRRPIAKTEWLLAFTTVTINAAISVAGWALWKSAVLHLNMHAGLLHILRDAVILTLAMDLALYVLHRVAHARMFYGIAHYKHHEYRDVRVVTLFVMHPFEAAGFGVLWVTTLCVYPFAVEAVVLFLQLNLYFGVAAHCGLPLYPRWLSHALSLISLTDPAFHALHHREERQNLGFYTSFWDRLFGTLAKELPPNDK